VGAAPVIAKSLPEGKMISGTIFPATLLWDLVEWDFMRIIFSIFYRSWMMKSVKRTSIWFF
jgi:hypothetical protein